MNKGFSLIEAILAIFIIGIAFFGLSFIFILGSQKALIADQTILATQLARAKMEEIISIKAAYGYGAVVSESTTNVSNGTWNFLRRVEVTSIDPSSFSDAPQDTGYKRVVVDVEWGSGSGESVSLQTIVTDQVPRAISSPGRAACP